MGGYNAAAGSMTDSLPKFARPPLVETVLGLDFEPIPNFTVPHFGLFWNFVREDYPNSTVQPPLVSNIEEFSENQKQQLTLSFSQVPEIRCWFDDQSGEWLVQIQRNRFISNWRSKQGSSLYPHYEKVLSRFWKEWGRFNEFLQAEGFNTPKVLQCEVTYINHIVAPFADAGRIFPSLAGLKGGNFLPLPEAVALNLVHTIPENRGRLYLSLQTVLRHADLRDVLQLSLTVKVLPKSSNESDINQAFSLGREWAVRGFADFTSEEMQQQWERR